MDRDLIIQEIKKENPSPLYSTINGESIELTPEEYEKSVQDLADMQMQQMEYKAKIEAEQAATAAAVAHAKSLGFTDDMIAVMYPNLAPSAP